MSQGRTEPGSRSEPAADSPAGLNRVALLTGGGDKPYALGLAEALTCAGVSLDFIGSDDLEVPEILNNPKIRFLNFRGDQRSDASPLSKVFRVIRYYARLIGYAATARPKILHILWNNKFESFDRTLLTFYYKVLHKRIALTVHNVNAAKRDGNDSILNRLTLRIQYHLADHLFVHTEQMKSELTSDLAVPVRKVSVIPFGLNSTVPNTALTAAEAKERLGLGPQQKAVLFFGNIAPYKGLEFLVEAMSIIAGDRTEYRLIIAGRVKGSGSYGEGIRRKIESAGLRDRVIERREYIPDEETELYFKAADVCVLPYTRIFQSGVLFLAYNFGLPVIVSNVGSLKEEIVESKTGYAFRSEDAVDLAKMLRIYFESELFRNLESLRPEIKEYAAKRYSWKEVAAITTAVYSNLLRR